MKYFSSINKFNVLSYSPHQYINTSSISNYWTKSSYYKEGKPQASDPFADIFKQAETIEQETLKQTEDFKEDVKEGKKATEGIAHIKRIKTSMLKLRDVTRLVQGLFVKEAIRQLQVTHRKVAPTILDAIKKAVANAKEQGIPQDRLIVSKIIIERKTPITRIQFKAKHRIGWGQGRNCGLRVYVTPEELLKGRKWENERMRTEIREKLKKWRAGELPVAAPVQNEQNEQKKKTAEE